MKILSIGCTGILSSACADLAIARGHELFILNRSVSTKYPLPEGATLLKGDIHADEAHLTSRIARIPSVSSAYRSEKTAIRMTGIGSG